MRKTFCDYCGKECTNDNYKVYHNIDEGREVIHIFEICPVCYKGATNEQKQ